MRDNKLVCVNCGRPIEEEQDMFHLCEMCEADALDRFKAFVTTEFSREQVDFLNWTYGTDKRLDDED